jgi:enamine deaminase RidA (YjgF/YER057c/UK114 family)
MITDRIDPPELLRIPEIVNVTIATGSRVIHVSGQTAYSLTANTLIGVAALWLPDLLVEIDAIAVV